MSVISASSRHLVAFFALIAGANLCKATTNLGTCPAEAECNRSFTILSSNPERTDLVYFIASDDAEGQGTSEFLTPMYKVLGKDE